MNIFLKRF